MSENVCLKTDDDDDDDDNDEAMNLFCSPQV